MKRGTLTDEQVESYHREGYLVVEEFFDLQTIETVNEAIIDVTERALEQEDYSSILELEPEPVDGRRVPRRIYDPYSQHEDFRQLLSDQRLLDCVEALIGPNIVLQYTKLNMKPPRVGSVVEWHQDMTFYPCTNDDFVTVLVYLDDATQENGCLRVLPRHHTHFFSHELPDGKFAGMITEDLESGKFGDIVSLEGKAGSVIFLHCIAPHSSLPNRSKHARRTLICEMRAADSFPIYFGNMTQTGAQKRIIRGKPQKFARFGGPRPLIPDTGSYTSIYDLQDQAKQKLPQRQQGAIGCRSRMGPVAA